jgi:DNA-binding response OmpR family regulator
LPLLRADVSCCENHAEEQVKGGTETLLVADDDATVLSLTEKVLKQFGYTVITAIDGVDAVSKFSENQDTISLVILDVIMPERNGKETLDEIRKISPDMKALFVSGYTADIIYNRGTFDESMEFLTKPIRPMNLLRKVRDVLDGAQPQLKSGGNHDG